MVVGCGGCGLDRLVRLRVVLRPLLRTGTVPVREHQPGLLLARPGAGGVSSSLPPSGDRILRPGPAGLLPAVIAD
jgi:hypothetical protein